MKGRAGKSGNKPIKRAGADLIFSYFALDLAGKNILR